MGVCSSCHSAVLAVRMIAWAPGNALGAGTVYIFHHSGRRVVEAVHYVAMDQKINSS